MAVKTEPGLQTCVATKRALAIASAFSFFQLCLASIDFEYSVNYYKFEAVFRNTANIIDRGGTYNGLSKMRKNNGKRSSVGPQTGDANILAPRGA